MCFTETKPPVWEARWEAEGQISSNMSDSLINIPAWDSFSSSVNRWNAGRQAAHKPELLEGILTVSFIAANNETGERRGWTCEFSSSPTPAFLSQKN